MAVPMLQPANQRQYIKRVPAYILSESFNKSTSPSGSWKTLSVNSKSASISSGYGTPKALQVDSCCRYIPPHHHSNSVSHCDTLVEDGIVPGKKRHYSAIKQHPGEIPYQRYRDTSVPLHHHPSDYNPPTFLPRLQSGTKVSSDRAWSFEKQQRYPNYICESHARQRDKHHLDYQHDYRHYPDYLCQRYSCNESHNAMCLSSSSSGSLREYDVDYSPVRPIYAPSPGRPRSSKWRSEANLFVSTLDEEATQIYNEILDVASSLASAERKNRAAEKHSSDDELNQQKPIRKYQSLYNLHNIDPQMESFEKVTSRQVPKPLDSRRSRRSGQERIPKIRRPSENTTENPDVEAESALAALEDVINLDFLKPSHGLLVKRKLSGPVPIIRAYLGETEDDWLKQQAAKMNGNVSPTISVIEIDESSDDEDRRRMMALPLDDVETTLLTPIHELNIGPPDQKSGNFSELSGDLSYISDIDG